MATIVIKDLPENTDLDRQAMQAITGGARLRGSRQGAVRAVPRDARAPDPSRNTARVNVPPAGRRPVPSILFK